VEVRSWGVLDKSASWENRRAKNGTFIYPTCRDGYSMGGGGGGCWRWVGRGWLLGGGGWGGGGGLGVGVGGGGVCVKDGYNFRRVKKSTFKKSKK